MSDLGARETNERTTEPAQGDAAPAVIAPPERKGRRDLTVIRQPDETDADYEARCSFVTLLHHAVEKA
jgi:hypothetical protein